MSREEIDVEVVGRVKYGQNLLYEILEEFRKRRKRRERILYYPYNSYV